MANTTKDKKQEQIDKIKRHNINYKNSLKTINDQIVKLNDEISKTIVVDKETYGLYVKKRNILSKLTCKVYTLNAKILLANLKTYQIRLISGNSNNLYPNINELFSYIKYVETLNPNDFYPFSCKYLIKIKVLVRYTMHLENRIILYKNVILKNANIDDTNPDVQKNFKTLKKLEIKLENYKNQINNIKVNFYNSYHASLVLKLSKMSMDAKIPEYEISNQEYQKHLNIINNANIQISDLKSKYKENLKLLKYQLKNNLISLKEYDQKFKELSNEIDEKLNVLEKNKKESIDYINKTNKFSLCENVIELKNVVKYYANKSLATKVLSNVNLTIKKGEFVVILGPSGSGKTTLLNIISGMDNATFGKTIIAGENLINYDQNKLTTFRRKNIGYVFQQYGLLPNLNVKENVEIGQNLQSDKSKIIDIDTILKSIDMYAQMKKYPNELSGGQQQRVSIARSVAKNPNILFGDEPTGAIDQETSKQIMKLFLDINKKYGTTVVIVTHNPILAQLASVIVNVGSGTIKSVIRNTCPKTIDEIDWTSGMDKFLTKNNNITIEK